MHKVRVLVVDDSVTIRAMIQTLLERNSRISVVGIARNAAEAEAMIATLNPDVITLDINMPGTDGLTLLGRIMRDAPRPVVMLSSLLKEGSRCWWDALDRGAAACFDKAMIVRKAAALIDTICGAARSGHWTDAEYAIAA